MWSALRSDLSEFVTTVTTDTSNVLSRMDDTFPDAAAASSPEQQEAIRRMKQEETFTTPLLPPSKEAKEEKPPAEEAKIEGPVEEQPDAEEKEAPTTDGQVDSNQQLLDEEEKKNIQEYLDSFSIEAKTDEIAAALEQYPESLKVMFESLVPTQVSYETFWTRYFYRCNVERIATEWAAQEERDREIRQAQMTQSIQGVKKFLGGAVQAVSASLAETDDDDDGAMIAVSPFGGASATSSEGGRGGGFFGSGGRPPFVMNTAVDDDDDDDDAVEEEELGWDDDDDDDDDDQQQEDEEVVFKDAATEKLQDDLKQALEERDQLHETVAMQAKEIAALKTAAGTEGGNSTTTAADEEVKRLKLQLFEKESELAAMKQSKTNDSMDSSNENAAQLAEMEVLLANTMAELQAQTEEAEAAKAALDQVQASSETQSLQETLAFLKSENASLRKELEEKLAEASRKQVEALTALQEELKASQSQVSSLTTELETTKGLLNEAQISQQQEETKSADSPETISSGEKVETPTVTKLSGDDNEDDWGDDW